MGSRFLFRRGQIVVFLILFANLASSAQKYPVSIEYSKALKNKTRDTSGLPGARYFTNWSDYNILVDFNPETGDIQGKSTIVYYNNSADTLKQIVLKLYYNILKKGNNRDFAVDPHDINDNPIEISLLKINDKSYKNEQIIIQGTIAIVDLNKPILPQTKANLEINWKTRVPQYSTIRTGRYPNNKYLVAYWYPQIAVYDDIFGWDKHSYTGTQEFYNDHNNYEVKITVPNPYIVWATGKLVTPFEVFTDKYANLLKKATYSDTVIRIIKPIDYQNGNILKNKTQNTFYFKATKVPDFAFAVSKDHNWDAVGISMPDREERVLINAVYADSSKLFHTLARTSRQLISYFSFQQPQIYYPYTSMTVFEGNGGMEYPMMVNIGHTDNPRSFYYVVAHEIAHSYFPFLCGTNETVYAWMDEGFINFFPRLAVDKLYNLNTINELYDNYQRLAGTIHDLPIMTPTDIYNKFFLYRNVAYNKPAFALNLLYEYLGDSLFFGAVRYYVQNWQYKHPYPADFFSCFENYTKQDFSWFFVPYFFEIKYPNFKIEKIRQEGGLYFDIVNYGGLPQPIRIVVEMENGTKLEFNKDLSSWKNKNIIDVYIPTKEKIKKIIFAPKVINTNTNL